MGGSSVTQLIQNTLKFDGAGSVEWRRDVRVRALVGIMHPARARILNGQPRPTLEYRRPRGRGRAGARASTRWEEGPAAGDHQDGGYGEETNPALAAASEEPRNEPAPIFGRNQKSQRRNLRTATTSKRGT